MAIAVGVLWLLSAYLILAHPLFGRRLYQKLKTGLVSRIFVYRRTLVLQWGTTVLTVIVFLFGRIPLRLLGLYNPNGIFLPSGVLGGMLIAVPVLILLITWLSALRFRMVHSRPGNGSDNNEFGNEAHDEQDSAKENENKPEESIQPSPDDVGEIAFLLPQTRQERFLFAALAVTAGICEEVLFRGMPVYLLNHQFPNLGPILVVLITALIFGVVHIYQGWIGMLSAAVLGALFTAIYLSTGALWIPMIVHALIDLRLLMIARKS